MWKSKWRAYNFFYMEGQEQVVEKKARRFFDPEYYHIILFDQRGCGRSIPFLELKENNIFYSVEDMEKIRLHIGIDKWTIFAGSYGSTLGLTYAIHYPEKVKRMVLQGIFLANEDDVNGISKKEFLKFIQLSSKSLRILFQ